MIQNDGQYRPIVRQPKRRGEVGVVITTLDGEMLKYGVQLNFSTSNNKAEYEGILTGLKVGKALGAKKPALPK